MQTSPPVAATPAPLPVEQPLPARRQRDAITAAALFVVTLVVYLPALGGGLLLDDEVYLTAPYLRSGDGLWRIWFEPGATQQYYPLLHTAFWLEHRAWGDAVLGYHLVNVGQHALAACLIVAIMRRLALPGAWLAGFLFALHPVCVESVAWMAEQKNTLSAVFYLAATYVYLGFQRDRRGATYAGASALFALALLTKTATLVLPAVLLVVAWWQRGRIEGRRDVVPLLPWLMAAVGLGQITAWIERHLLESVNAEIPLTLLERCLMAGRAFWFYLGKVVWPADLAFIYPSWRIDASDWRQYLFPLGAMAALAFSIGRARRGHRGTLAAVLIFGGTLFPVLGFFNVYWFLFAPVADHLQYLAIPALVILIATAAARLSGKLPSGARNAAAAVGLAILAALSVQQSRLYRDGESLYRATLVRNPAAWIAHQNLGTILLGLPGRGEEAAAHLEMVLQLQPRLNLAGVHSNLAVALSTLPERSAEVLHHLQAAVRLRPDLAEARNNLASVLADIPGRMPEALVHCEEAVRLKPDYIDARLNLASLFAAQARFSDARQQLEAILQLDAACEPARQFLAQLPKEGSPTR